MGRLSSYAIITYKPIQRNNVRASKSNILEFLTEIKPKLLEAGIFKLGLFGSFARDEAGVYSDIDIAIEKKSDYLKIGRAHV